MSGDESMKSSQSRCGFGFVGASEGKYGAGMGILQSLGEQQNAIVDAALTLTAESSLLRESFRMCYKLSL